MILNYNIHNILKLRLVREHNKILDLKPLDMEFSFFETKKVKPDITVNIKNNDFKSDNEGCSIVDHKYHIKYNYFFCKDDNWKVEIKGFEKGPTVINFYEYPMRFINWKYASLPISDHVIIPIIDMKLAQKNYFLTHSAAVSKDNNGILLPGPAGSFKTTLAMKLVRKGYDFLADDLAIIKNKKIYSFPRFPSVFRYRVENKDTENLNIFDKLKIRKNYRKTHIKKFIKKTNLDLILFLSRMENNCFRVKKINKDDAVKKLIINSELENTFNSFYKYNIAYSVLFPFKERLPTIDIKDVPCFSIEYSKDNIDNLLKWIGKML